MSAGALHLEVLPSPARTVLARLGPPVTKRGFYMAGGTALALQLGHRRSVDFDWFREANIEDPVALARELDVEVRSTSENTLHAVAEGVRISCFRYPYALLQPLVPAGDLGCSLAPIADIAAMKLAAISQRGSRRDYHDVVAIGRAGLDLAGMLEGFRSKFSIRDVGHVLAALAWFDDADRDPEPVLAAKESWDEVKATVRAWVKRYAAR